MLEVAYMVQQLRDWCPLVQHINSVGIDGFSTK